MSRSNTTLRVAPATATGNGALDLYLAEDAKKSRRRLPGSLADEAIQTFQNSLRNLTIRCESFMLGSENSVAHLVLGKVQSGKTAHLLGSLAWAADSEVMAAVVFTGVTGSLNDQTQSRLIKDLENLPGNPVKVLLVPTISQKSLFARFAEELHHFANARATLGSTEPLPVLVSMKNPSRAKAVAESFKILAEKIGSSAVVLSIDDEADQASQNAKARQRSIAATYEALSKIRGLPVRNIWLSYTATPQAVLLTEKFGALRPDYVSIVPPRSGYFGLEDAMSEDYARQLVEVSDWRIKARDVTSTPQSLIDAIWRFLYVAWVRKRHPNSFYNGSPVKYSAASRLNSSQMLIHESSMKADHSRMFKLVGDELERLEGLVVELVAGRVNPNTKASYFAEFEKLANLLSENGADASALFPDFESNEGQLEFLELLRGTKVLVVNSDGSSPSAGEQRPVDDDDYAANLAWILIGGDILGRGITIPQLTVSYFLRSAKTPNFDTVLQQLRFCGYRQDYRNWTSIHASRPTLEDLKYMDIVDRALWARASTWDRDSTKISGDGSPRVFYASSKQARFEPTRASVRDPDLVDRKVENGSLFSLREIFEPRDFNSNHSLLRRWLSESGIQARKSSDNWVRIEDIKPSQLTEVMLGWEGSGTETSMLSGIAELFDPALGELGLFDTPNVMFIHPFLLENWASPEQLLKRVSEVEVTRTAHVGNPNSNLAEWASVLKSFEYMPMESRARLAVPHIGGGQRALKDQVGYEAVTFIIEPILGLRVSRDRTTAIALGIGFAALSPDYFEIRTLGHA